MKEGLNDRKMTGSWGGVCKKESLDKEMKGPQEDEDDKKKQNENGEKGPHEE